LQRQKMAFDKDAFLTALDNMTGLGTQLCGETIEIWRKRRNMAAPAAGGGAAAAVAEEKTDFAMLCCSKLAHKSAGSHQGCAWDSQFRVERSQGSG
jgi:large subunit ribosomal protein L7/L12